MCFVLGIVGVGVTGWIISAIPNPWTIVILVPVLLNISAAALYYIFATTHRLF